MPPLQPTKLTPEVQEKILGYIRQGSFIETAAAAAGITKQCLHGWLRRGAEDPDSVYGAFEAAVRAVAAESQHARVQAIEKAALEDWRAAAWLLERQYPRQYGAKVEHTGEDGGPVRHEVKIDPAALARKIEQIAAKLPPGTDEEES